MSLATWTNILRTINIIIITIALVKSYLFGMHYYNNCMSVLKEILNLRLEGKIDGETHTRLLDAISKYDKKKKK